MIVAIPKLKVKKEWPTASNIPEAVKLSQFGLNKNESDSVKPSRVNALIKRRPRIPSKAGIKTLFHLSRPFFTPEYTIATTNDIKIACQNNWATSIVK